VTVAAIYSLVVVAAAAAKFEVAQPICCRFTAFLLLIRYVRLWPCYVRKCCRFLTPYRTTAAQS